MSKVEEVIHTFAPSIRFWVDTNQFIYTSWIHLLTVL